MSCNNDSIKKIWGEGLPIALMDFTQHSKWPARLLGLEQWAPPKRNKVQALREYEKETYQPQLNLLKNDPALCCYDALFRVVYPSITQMCCLMGKELRMMTPDKAFQVQLLCMESVVKSVVDGCPLVDFGAGNGRNLMGLATRLESSSLFGLDMMPSALRVMKLMAARLGINLKVGKCDFHSKKLTEVAIPEQSVLMTSYATCFVSFDYHVFMEAIKNLKFKLIANFEPIYDFMDNTLMGQMQKSYMIKNAYNVDFFSKLFADPLVEIQSVEKNIFGTNPLLPMSSVVWKFRGHQ
mgnify:CR=1 FL=1